MRMVSFDEITQSTSRILKYKSHPIPEAVITVVRAPDDGYQQPKHVELPTEIQGYYKRNRHYNVM